MAKTEGNKKSGSKKAGGIPVARKRIPSGGRHHPGESSRPEPFAEEPPPSSEGLTEEMADKLLELAAFAEASADMIDDPQRVNTYYDATTWIRNLCKTRKD